MTRPNKTQPGDSVIMRGTVLNVIDLADGGSLISVKLKGQPDPITINRSAAKKENRHFYFANYKVISTRRID